MYLLAKRSLKIDIYIYLSIVLVKLRITKIKNKIIIPTAVDILPCHTLLVLLSFLLNDRIIPL